MTLSHGLWVSSWPDCIPCPCLSLDIVNKSLIYGSPLTIVFWVFLSYWIQPIFITFTYSVDWDFFLSDLRRGINKYDTLRLWYKKQSPNTQNLYSPTAGLSMLGKDSWENVSRHFGRPPKECPWGLGSLLICHSRGHQGYT